MDSDSIKYAAAYLADTLHEVHEKRAAGLYESAEADPTKYTLMGAGAGALIGGAGGGLMSWLRRDKDEEGEGKTLRDTLAGALIGGGLGAGAGALPGLLKGIQTGKTPPGPLKDPTGKVLPPTKGLVGAATSDVSNLVNLRTAAGGMAGATGSSAILLSMLRGQGLEAVKSMNDTQVLTTLEQLGKKPVPPGTPPHVARSMLNSMLQGTSARGMARGLFPKALQNTRAARLLGVAPQSIGRYFQGNLNARNVAGGLSKIKGKKTALISALVATLVGAGVGGKYIP